MSFQGSPFGGFPLASLFSQGQMSPLQGAMPQANPMAQNMTGAPGGPNTAMGMQPPGGPMPQTGMPMMLGGPNPGMMPGQGQTSPLMRQMMMARMMSGQGQGANPRAGGVPGMASNMVTPAMNFLMARKFGVMQ